MRTFRLRVEHPHESDPIRVTDQISALGGHVVSVDLCEVDGATEVNELVVDVPEPLDGAKLRSALEHDANASLLSARPCSQDEPTSQARRWALSVERWEFAGLHQRLAAACPFSSVSIRPVEEARSLPAVEMALERRASVAHRSMRAVGPSPNSVGRSPRWLLAVPEQCPDPGIVALLGRATSLPFTAAEVARVELVMAS